VDWLDAVSRAVTVIAGLALGVVAASALTRLLEMRNRNAGSTLTRYTAPSPSSGSVRIIRIQVVPSTATSPATTTYLFGTAAQ
jgi:hypothetical protein